MLHTAEVLDTVVAYVDSFYRRHNYIEVGVGSWNRYTDQDPYKICQWVPFEGDLNLQQEHMDCLNMIVEPLVVVAAGLGHTQEAALPVDSLLIFDSTVGRCPSVDRIPAAFKSSYNYC